MSLCLNFKNNCEMSKRRTLNKLIYFKKNKKKICGYGATSKSTTILNYCKIGPDIIDCIFDTTKEKNNKYSPGMHIPIVKMNKSKFNMFDISVICLHGIIKKKFLKKKSNF